MGKKSKKEQIIMMQRELEKLKEQRAAEELRTREGVAAGITMPAITKLSEFPNRDLKKIGKNLSAYVDESIRQFVDEKAAAKVKAAGSGTDAPADKEHTAPSGTQLKVEFTFEGDHPGYRIVDNDVAGSFIPAEQEVENILLTSYLQGAAKEER